MATRSRTVGSVSLVLLSLLSYGLGPLMQGASGLVLPACLGLVAFGLAKSSDNRFLKYATFVWAFLATSLMVVGFLLVAGSSGVNTTGLG